ncbi:SDR family oxidoreductase [Phanerochaete sordida]|uniref:SDR family oxidoreductase n=1 Tax=Phanerochaete sordida TaxID=48140 RepID=A0A9P3G7V4_9APHY|nr:SDR family oxidoreductase [Phanerochaete sordida]
MSLDLPVTNHHGIYPTIDPTPHFESKTFRNKVVLVTGATRGVGRETARHFARAGASLALVSRHHAALEDTKAAILHDAPGTEIMLFEADVRAIEASEAVVKATVQRFGRLDVLVANAGATAPLTTRIGDKDPSEWWHTFEVNIKGVFNFVRPALPYLEKSSGYIVALTSGAGHFVVPNGSDYCISKHAVDRLVECIVAEYPPVKAFSLHPGQIDTVLSRSCGLDFERPDSAELPAATMLYLTSGRADWLSGRYISANWDLQEVERDWKEKIIEQSGLVDKLHIPS